VLDLFCGIIDGSLVTDDFVSFFSVSVFSVFFVSIFFVSVFFVSSLVGSFVSSAVDFGVDFDGDFDGDFGVDFGVDSVGAGLVSFDFELSCFCDLGDASSLLGSGIFFVLVVGSSVEGGFIVACLLASAAGVADSASVSEMVVIEENTWLPLAPSAEGLDLGVVPGLAFGVVTNPFPGTNSLLLNRSLGVVGLGAGVGAITGLDPPGTNAFAPTFGTNAFAPRLNLNGFDILKRSKLN